MSLVLVAPAHAQRQMENLSRGIVAVKQPDGGVYVGCAGLSYVGSGDVPYDGLAGRVGFVYVDGRGRYGRDGYVGCDGCVYDGREPLTVPTLPAPRIVLRVKR